MSDFRIELRGLINRFSVENGSDTPDFILVEYLVGCLAVFEEGVNKREQWYGRGPGSRKRDIPESIE